MYGVRFSARFKKEYKKIIKQGKNPAKLKQVINYLIAGEKLPSNYCEHTLKGNYSGCKECHIEPDWLIIYYYEEDKLILVLSRTGSHSDLLNK